MRILMTDSPESVNWPVFPPILMTGSVARDAGLPGGASRSLAVTWKSVGSSYLARAWEQARAWELKTSLVQIQATLKATL